MKIIETSTDEYYVPIRLYYSISKLSSFKKSLRKLKCVQFNSDNEFVISYFKEAKDFNLSVDYQDVPKESYPIILAKGSIVGDSILHLDVRSFKRAVELTIFIAKRITNITLTEFVNYSRIPIVLEGYEEDCWNIDYDQLFSDENIHIMDLESMNLTKDKEEDIYIKLKGQLLKFDIVKTIIMKNITFENAVTLLIAYAIMIEEYMMDKGYLDLKLMKYTSTTKVPALRIT